ncbi:MAG: aspartate aminotransferase family protein [Gammaproteobacteria bacterium]|nr:aspartate aminotransferase family protein [Gammaproteobacteria bacterium]
MQPPPRAFDPSSFRPQLAALTDWIVAYYEQLPHLPVLSRSRPGEIFNALPATAPELPDPFDEVLADLDQLILPGLTHWQSPNFFAYFPANASGPSMLADLLSAALGVQGMLWQTSPACTELETRMLDWLAEACALPAVFRAAGAGGGVLQDSASSATLCALIAARERATGGSSNELGYAGGLVAYTSSQAHSSLDKAVMLAGIGRANLRKIEVDENFALRPAALAAAMAADRAAGLRPFFVGATVGTTSSLACDPLGELGRLCQRAGVWLHVDAAMAGSAALLPEERGRFAGLELADSYCFNPHKWLLTNFDCCCFYVACRQDLVAALSVTPAYLNNDASASGGSFDYRDWQIPLGRRFRALKLWFVLRGFGLAGLRALLRHHLLLAARFAGWVAADPDFQLVAPVSLNLVCFRYRASDDFNRRLQACVNAEGRLFISHTALAGQHVLRLCVGQAATSDEHVAQAWSTLRQTAARLNQA